MPLPPVDTSKPISSQLTTDQVVEYYFGITPVDIFLIARELDQQKYSDFWTRAYNLLAGIDTLSERNAAEKALNAAKEVAEFDHLGYLRNLSHLSSGPVPSALEKIIEQVRQAPLVRIGTMSFGPEFLDPQDIRISEVYMADSAQCLRGDTDVTYRLPRAVTKITVDLTFTGRATINDRLRRLMAELRVCPVTTIESAFLVHALVNQFASPELEQELAVRIANSDNSAAQAQLDSLVTESTQSFETVKEALQNEDMYLEVIRQRILKTRPGSIISPDLLNGKIDSLLDAGIMIPVTISDIVVSTDPTSPNTLHVRLVFIRHNADAFGSTGLEFMDAHGNATPDINRCPWIEKLVNLTYLNPSQPDIYLSEYITTENKPDLECRWHHVLDRDSRGKLTFPSQGTTGKFIVESVQANFGFAIAPIPLLGSKYPAVQIMGQTGVQAKIVIVTTSTKIVREIHLMKDHLDAIARNVGGLFRDESIEIDNAVLNCMGGRDFVITNVETYPFMETSNATAIEITLAQAKYSREKQQSLILDQSGGVPEGLYEEFMAYLFQKYKQYADNPFDFTDSPTGSNQEIREAMRFLFGTGEGKAGKGILNASTLLAGILKVIYDSGRATPLLNGNTNPIFTELGELGYATDRWVKQLAKRYLSGNNGQLVTTGDGLVFFQDGALDGRVVQYTVGGITATLVRGDPTDNLDGVYQFLTDGQLKISPSLWKAITEVIRRPQPTPRASDSGTIWSQDDIVSTYQSITRLFTTGIITRFSGFRNGPLEKWLKQQEKVEFINTDTGQIERTLKSNYPDLHLPTYQDVFSTDNKLDLLPVNGDKPPLQVWTRFAPTYLDIGEEPPFDDKYFLTGDAAYIQIAREVTDSVEPGFFYYHKKTKSRMVAAAIEETESRGKQNDFSTSPEHHIDPKFIDPKNVLKVEINTEQFRLSAATPEEANRNLATTLANKIDLMARSRGEDGSATAQEIESGKFTKNFYIVDSEGELIALILPNAKSGVHQGAKFDMRVIRGNRPLYFNTTLGLGYDRKTGDRARSLMKDIIRKSKDNTYSAVRHYPAFRVYFVEFDNNYNRDEGGPAQRLPNGVRIKLVDDLYTTNAVMSVNITHDKDDASVAVFQILNTRGTFDTDEFVEAPDPGQRFIDDEGEDYLRRMKLKFGTGIVIKMGYTSDPAHLDTVFTGQIVEIENGPIVTVTAQSYKNELFQEINYFQGGANAREAINGVVQKMPLPHLGRAYDVRDASDEQYFQDVGSSVANNSTKFFGLAGDRGVLAKIFGGKYSNATRNIWWESNYDQNGWLGEAARDTAQAVLDVVPFGDKTEHYWLFDRQTIWDSVQEICRHYPGLVADVRPYDTEATLFVGFPDQVYSYRTPKPRELVAYKHYLDKLAPVDTKVVNDNLIANFRTSDFGTTAGKHTIQTANFHARFKDEDLDKLKVAIDGDLAETLPSFSVATTVNLKEWGVIKVISRDLDIINYTSNLDFRKEWDFLQKQYPGLAQYLTAFFFRFRQDNWGSFDGVWRSKFADWMSPLSNYQSIAEADHTDLDDTEGKTAAGRSLINTLVGDFNQLGQPFSTLRTDDPDLEAALNGTGNLTPFGFNARDIMERALSQTNSDPLKVTAVSGDPIGQVLFKNWLKFRLFVFYFVQYIQSDTVDPNKLDLAREALERLAKFAVPPGFRTFRSYHTVFDKTDIIDNKIVASEAEMANTVAIHCPTENVWFDTVDVADGSGKVSVIEADQEWTYFPNEKGVPFHPSIDRSSRKLYVATEPNANNRAAQANTFTSNIAIALWPLYRGWIKILGRSVMPWDIVYIQDNFTNMIGPVEVARVTHEFSRETGWITTIEPHAVVVPMDASDKYTTSAWSSIASALGTALDVASLVAAAMLVFSGVGAVAGVAVAARLAARQALVGVVNKAAKRSILQAVKASARSLRGSPTQQFWGLAAKSGLWLGGMREARHLIDVPLSNLITNLSFKMNFDGELWPVHVLPITHKGLPLYAGLSLSDREIFSFGDLAEQAYKNTIKDIRSWFSGESPPGVTPGPGEGD